MYKHEITGSHFKVGGMDQIIMPLYVSLFITSLLKLSTAAFQI